MELVQKRQNGVSKYKNHRAEPYFTYVKNGQKTIEGRLRKGLYAELAVGDFITVQTNDETESVLVKVADLRLYDSFAAMLATEDVHKILPNVDTPEAGVAVYRQFYTEDQERKHGVVAIEVLRV